MQRKVNPTQHTLFVLCITLLIFQSCAVSHRFTDFKNRKIHHFEMVKIGGIKQAILINGKEPDNPVLLYLHGGPGFPMLPFVPYSENMKMLEEYFTIVYWEQRGTGKSYHNRMGSKSMNLDQFVHDTREIVDYIGEQLGVEKIFLWGHSWGTNFGALYAAQHPETLHAYISTGQSVNPFLNERLCYEFVKQRATKENNRRALRQLARIDTVPANYTIDNALTIRKWVYRYGGIVYQNRNVRPYVDLEEIATILTAPDYSLSVRLNILLNPYFSIEKLWEDLKGLNLEKEAPEINVPVYFLVGRHDIIVSALLAEKYFQQLEAPRGKELIWFEESAHRPFAEEDEKFLQVMKTIQEAHRSTYHSGKKKLNLPE